MPVMRRLLLWSVLLPLLWVGFGAPTRAAPLQLQCEITLTDINFGRVFDLTRAIETVGTISVGCSRLRGGYARVCISFPYSQSSTSSYELSNGLSYQIFTDASRTQPWPQRLIFVPYVDISSATEIRRINFYAKVITGLAGVPTGKQTGTLFMRVRVYPYGALESPPSCAAPSGYFGTQYYQFGASVDIQPSCAISASPLIFPPQTTLTADVLAQSSLLVTCTLNALYWVGLNDGQNAAAGQRRMRSGANFINYELYSDGARTARWGATKDRDTVSGAVSGAGQLIPVYGKIPRPPIPPPPGIYTDTIIVTINF
jgi:spore coat protein U-like protein